MQHKIILLMRRHLHFDSLVCQS